LFSAPAQYGGCVANASAGISGHDKLTGTRQWTISDNGKVVCSIGGSIIYSPDMSVWTNSGVTATLTLDTTGTVSSAGWSPSGSGLVFTKTYTSNT
jgi:hypothetical protein